MGFVLCLPFVARIGRLILTYYLSNSTLHSLNLPASIDAVLQPIGLPPSLVDKSREIKSEGGVERLRTMMSDVRRVGKVNQKLLNEVS